MHLERQSLWAEIIENTREKPVEGQRGAKTEKDEVSISRHLDGNRLEKHF